MAVIWYYMLSIWGLLKRSLTADSFIQVYLKRCPWIFSVYLKLEMSFWSVLAFTAKPTQ